MSGVAAVRDISGASSSAESWLSWLRELLGRPSSSELLVLSSSHTEPFADGERSLLGFLARFRVVM